MCCLQVWIGNASALAWAALCATTVVLAIHWATVQKVNVRMGAADELEAAELDSPINDVTDPSSPLLNNHSHSTGNKNVYE